MGIQGKGDQLVSFELRKPSYFEAVSTSDSRLNIARLPEGTTLLNRRPRVLYVDDDADSREILILLLKGRRIEATGASNAIQALSLVQTERFDLYLLDVGLPDRDGFDLCRQLRELRPEIPVLFFSGWAGEAYRKKGLEAGAIAYVAKPHLDRLIISIMHLVSSARIQPHYPLPPARS
jgi:CheY-like chemotaxis protein